MHRVTHFLAYPLAMFLFIASASAADSSVIVIKKFMFNPMNVTVPAGTDVTWENEDGEPHTVVSLTGDFRSQALDQNDSFRFTFQKPGVYRYICSIHPSMRAAITVK